MCLVLASLGLSVSAADGAVVPPGNSAATQYSETLPGAGGEEARNKGGANPEEAAAGAPAVPSQTASELRALGAEGEAALKLANTTAPPHVAGEPGGKKGKKESKQEKQGTAAGGGSGDGPGAGGGTGLKTAGSSGVGEVLGGVAGTSSGGLGFFQPLIIALVLICAVAYALRRRRGAEPEAGSS